MKTPVRSIVVAPALFAATVCAADAACAAVIRGAALLEGFAEAVILDERERLTLAPAAAGPGHRSSGEHRVELELPRAAGTVSVNLIRPDVPQGEASAQRPSSWPAAVCDIIVQVRFRGPDDSWSPWQPRNLLAGGGFADRDGNGIPDGVTVMRLRAEGASLAIGAPGAIPPCPENSWWHGKTILREGSMVAREDLPPGVPAALALARDVSDGQDTAEMRRDLVPPGATLTVSGWNRYDIGGETSMGVMSRFHEFDAAGRRIGKYVLLGDDDFHQPSGAVPWQWRALTFTTSPETVRLGIYPVRMIRARGRAWAAGWEIRESAVFAGWGEGRILLQEEFGDPAAWDAEPADAAEFRTDGATGALLLAPAPGSVATARRRAAVPLRADALYAFRIDMGNDVPAGYDRTHDAWVSCYLEFRDDAGRVLDTVKAMAFRPDPAHPLGAAAFAPPETTQGTFFVAASHMSYADAGRLRGTMLATFRRLQLEESAYDPGWSPRPPGYEIAAAVPDGARSMQIRARLLTRDTAAAPSFAGYEVRYAAPESEPSP